MRVVVELYVISKATFQKTNATEKSFLKLNKHPVIRSIARRKKNRYSALVNFRYNTYSK